MSVTLFVFCIWFPIVTKIVKFHDNKYLVSWWWWWCVLQNVFCAGVLQRHKSILNCVLCSPVSWIYNFMCLNFEYFIFLKGNQFMLWNCLKWRIWIMLVKCIELVCHKCMWSVFKVWSMFTSRRMFTVAFYSNFYSCYLLTSLRNTL